jgi:outer membrane protein assembly factor BamD
MLFIGCAHHSDEVLSKDSDLLWDLATKAYDTADWYNARIYFDKFQRFYPESSKAVVARLKLADAYYQDFKFFDAEVHYENFLELHPTHAEVPYAWYQLALSQKNQVPGLIARDLSKAHDAIRSFATYLKLPNRNINLDVLAEDHHRELEVILMRKDFEIGDWYYKLGHSLSAFLRFKEVLGKYIHLKKDQEELLFESLWRMTVSAIHLKSKAKLSDAKLYLSEFESYRRHDELKHLINQTNTDLWIE